MGSRSKVFVGFGFGPIQSGLFLYEAAASGNFSRCVVAEVDSALVQAVRANGGQCDVNIAGNDGIRTVRLEGLEIYDPAVAEDRAAIIAAVAMSDEMATCLPSVNFYDAGGATSVARMIGEGLMSRAKEFPTVIYAAENNNKAAEHLGERISLHAGNAATGSLQVLNTVIGKMSGTIADSNDMDSLGTAPLVPGLDRAVLVEAFNSILISGIELPGFERGIGVFVEKPDLLPFEEAKLYGHNAVHALIGYLCGLAGFRTMDEAVRRPEIMAIARRAFLDETCPALIKRHGWLDDPLFTVRGYERYADDLLARMTNPYLNDLVARVCRDPKRKLGYDDRIFGTMRLALGCGVDPENMALGAAAAVAWQAAERDRAGGNGDMVKQLTSLCERDVRQLLSEDWGDAAGIDAPRLVDATWQGVQRLRLNHRQ